jgi:hypothetical protein
MVCPRFRIGKDCLEKLVSLCQALDSDRDTTLRLSLLKYVAQKP